MVTRLVGALTMAVVLGGCSIQLQSPVREVAYDFSDRDFYDRAYAPSPAYAPAPEALRPAPTAPPAGGRGQPADTCEGGSR